MTVIAFDGKTLAADKRGSLGNTAVTTTKIRRIFGDLVGAAGSADGCRTMVAWFEAGAEPEKFPKCQDSDDLWAALLVIKPNGSIWRYERTPHPFEIEDKFAATGSGRDFALAAMHCGKTAREAVEIASLYDTGCGNGVDTLELAQ